MVHKANVEAVIWRKSCDMFQYKFIMCGLNAKYNVLVFLLYFFFES